MAEEELATMFKALGDPTRLKAFQYLRECCPDGDCCDADECRPTAGEVCCEISGAEKITSTMSFHLKELRNAGLINMEKQGKYVVCGVNQEAVHKMSRFLANQSQEQK